MCSGSADEAGAGVGAAFSIAQVASVSFEEQVAGVTTIIIGIPSNFAASSTAFI